MRAAQPALQPICSAGAAQTVERNRQPLTRTTHAQTQFLALARPTNRAFATVQEFEPTLMSPDLECDRRTEVVLHELLQQAQT